LGYHPCAKLIQRPNVRVFSIRTVCSRLLGVGRSCDSRKYTYCFPTYLLIPPKPGSGLYETFSRQAASTSSGSPSACAVPHGVHAFWVDSAPQSSKEDDLQRKRRWRTSPETVHELREIAKKFEGTRNFHNFTVGREFSDRSTQRHMKKIEVSHLLKRVLASYRGIDCRPSCLW
jgi:tRNA pseudouridine38-40 synthase